MEKDIKASIGDDVFCIGYPSASRVQGSRNPFEGNFQGQPIFSFGRIASRISDLDYFWADISVFPGNSGGPVVWRDRLIGFVHAGPLVDVIFEKNDAHNSASVPAPFGQMLKSSLYFPLLKELQRSELSLSKE